MASAPRVPGVREAARLAVVDLYHHSIRFVAVNVAWGLGLIGLLAIATWGAPLLALVLAPLLALPLVGMARIAGEVVRGEDVVLADAWDAVRELAVPGLIAGALGTIAGVVLASNVLLGLATGSALAVAIAVAAGWGLVALALVAFPFWVLLADPARRGRGLAGAVRDGTALLLVEPVCLLALTTVLTIVLVVGTILVAAILTVAVAYAVLVTARVVIPVADRLVGPTGVTSQGDPPEGGGR
jgi:hypothetical protein